MSIPNYKKKAEARHKKQRAKKLKAWKRDIAIYQARKLLLQKKGRSVPR